MAEYPEEFLRLADRFVRIDGPDSLTADGYVQRLAARACKLVAHCDRIGVLPLGFIKGFPDTGGVYEDDTDRWQLPWIILCLFLKKHFPERVPADVGVQRGMTPGDPERGGPGAGAMMVPSDWRQRAEDYADVCRLLARLCDQDSGSKLQSGRMRPF